MKTIGERIRERRESLNMSQEYLAKMLGYKSRSSINKIECGDRNLTQTKIKQIADVLDTTPAYIMGWEDEGNCTIIRNIIPMPKTRKIPLIGTIACGTPIVAEQNYDEEVVMPENIDADFALRCKGDSMIDARICDGDIVYIRQQETFDNGQIVAVLIGEEATLKRVFADNGNVMLVPCNNAYKPIIITGEEASDFRILGVAVGFTSLITVS